MTESEKCEVISKCENFDDLIKAFEEIGEISGSSKTYSPETMKHKILQLRILLGAQGFHKRLPFNVVTRKYGIRAKAIELSWYLSNEI